MQTIYSANAKTTAVPDDQAPTAPSSAPPASAFSSGLASAEGWDVFDCGTRADGSARVEIQRIDCPETGEPEFPDDPAAWKHVLNRAADGSALHQRALQMIDRTERFLIEAECGWWPGC